jgi:hypothetical protein
MPINIIKSSAPISFGHYRRLPPLVVHHPCHQLAQLLAAIIVERSDGAGNGLWV